MTTSHSAERKIIDYANAIHSADATIEDIQLSIRSLRGMVETGEATMRQIADLAGLDIKMHVALLRHSS